MKLIDRLRKTSRTSLYLNSFHKVALGLFTGTVVYAVPCQVDERAHVELFIGVFKPKQWQNLWRLDLKFIDEVGVVADALDVLKLANCNLMSMETLTTETGSEHQILAFLETTEPVNDEDAFGEGLRKKLSHKLGSRFKSCDVSRLLVLKNAYERFIDKFAGTSVKYIEGEIQGTDIIWRNKNFEQLFAKTPDRRHCIPARHFCYSDSEQKYLCFIFVDDKSPIAEIGMKHADEPGVWHSFASTIKDHGADILASFSRRVVPGISCEWTVTLDLTKVTNLGSMLTRISQQTFFKRYLQLKLSYTPGPHAEESPLIENPFRYTDELFWEKNFVGRSRIVETVIDPFRVNSSSTKGDNFLISGYFKTGKSSLLLHVQRDLCNAGISAIYWVAKGSSATSLWSDLLNAIHRELLTKIAEDFWHRAMQSWRDSIRASSQWIKRLNKGSLTVTGFSFDTSLSVEMQRQEILEAFEFLIGTAKAAGIELLVVLVDEAQTLLSSELVSDQKFVAQTWQLIGRSFPQIKWIIASSEQWRGGDGHMGFLAKFREICVTPISDEEATELLERGFREAELYCPQFIVHMIVKLSGGQPCYIQALGSALVNYFGKHPRRLRVIDEIALADAIGITTTSLHSHFSDLRGDLTEIFGVDCVDRLLEGGEFEADMLRRHALPLKEHWNLNICALPCFVIDRYSETLATCFSVTPLFVEWHKRTVSSSSTTALG